MSGSISEQDTNALVKEALGKFIYEHTGQDALSAIDEIVLSYVVSILESLGSPEAAEDAFDVDQFSEMMSAYIPTFNSINSTAVCEWMFDLAAWLSEVHEQKGRKTFLNDSSIPCSIPQSDTFTSISSDSIPLIQENEQLSSSPRSSSSRSRSRSTSQSEDEDRLPNHISMDTIELEQQLDILAEMFPHICTMEVQHCLTVSGGDCQKAVQLILQRQENGEQITSPVIPVQGHKPSARRNTDNALRDKKLREQILNRYAYIDKDDDAREHRPVAPKSEPKKLIRYRDNKIVSVKGERYTEVKSEDMKKTYVTLKPARQYRFH